MLIGTSCNDEIFKTRKAHIISEALPPPFSSFCSSRIALSPAGVAAQPSPRILAAILAAIYSLALWRGGMSGNNQWIKGYIVFAIFFIRPLFTAISIMPFQTPITPSIKIHKFTASVEDEIKLSVICPIVP